MISEDSLKLDKLLDEVLHGISGIRHVVLVDRDGFVIRAVSFQGQGDSDFLDKIGVIGAAMFQAAEEKGFCQDFGEIRVQITEYQNCFIFACSCGVGVLIVVCEKRVQIGSIYFLMKKYQNEFDIIVKDLFSSDPQKIGDDVKELFLSEWK